MFTAWIVCLLFAFKWYRKWGGWTSDEFVVVSCLCVVLPVVLAVWLGSGFSPDEHLKRLLRSRVYVLAMMVRLLLLLNLGAVLAIVGQYLIELRGDPRRGGGMGHRPRRARDGRDDLADHRLPPPGAAPRLAVRRRARLLGLPLVALRPRQLHGEGAHALVLACWGAFIGLFPPVFLCDEVEGVSPKDMLYAGSLAAVGLIVPLLTLPTMTGTAIKAWSDRASTSTGPT